MKLNRLNGAQLFQSVAAVFSVAFLFTAQPVTGKCELGQLQEILAEFRGGDAVRAQEAQLAALIAVADDEGIQGLYDPIAEKLDLLVSSFFDLDFVSDPEIYSKLKSSVNQCELAGIALWTLMNVIVDGGEKPLIRDGIVVIDGSLKDEEFNLRMGECASSMAWQDYQVKIGKYGNCLETAFLDEFHGDVPRSPHDIEQCKSNPDFTLMQGGGDESLLPELSDTP